MIKRITFATAGGNDRAGLRESWPAIVAAVLDAPGAARPVRVASCVALPDVIPDPAHDAIGLEWFADADHLRRFEDWLAAAGPAPAGLFEPSATAVVVAQEHVLRGSDWLEQRWTTGGPCLKHMAVARRAAGLTPAEFSQRWQNHAGRVGTTPIPDVAKGCAYAQNHPLPRPNGDWLYDAINEVWFDDLEALRTRIQWMTDALSTSTDDDDLIGESSFIAVREQVLT
jgi:EthD domain-containing protein